jgi:hypothetical protein
MEENLLFFFWAASTTATQLKTNKLIKINEFETRQLSLPIY